MLREGRKYLDIGRWLWSKEGKCKSIGAAHTLTQAEFDENIPFYNAHFTILAQAEFDENIPFYNAPVPASSHGSHLCIV
jgi:hypothetical protein